MNYIRKKCTNGGASILLSADKDKLKQHVLTEINLMDTSFVPCCIISYDEICDNTEGNIERTSDLNPFINININADHKNYLPNLISCLLTIEYNHQFTENEENRIKEVCDEIDYSKGEVRLYDIFKKLQTWLKLPDHMQRIYTKIDTTVETIKNRKDFYCEVSDPTLLFFNFVYTILSLKEVYSGTRVWIYTDILQHIYIYDNVLAFLQNLLSKIDSNMFTVNFMITEADVSIPLSKLNVRFVQRLDGPESFQQYRDYFKINQLRWKYMKMIEV